MKNIGLVVAVEIDAVDKLFGEPVERKKEHSFDIRIYSLPQGNLIVVHCGIGTIMSSCATMLLMEKYKVDAIFNFGLVGALTEEIAKTPLVLVKQVFDTEMDVSDLDLVPKGQHEGYSSPYLSLDKNLLSAVSALRPDLPLVTCASGNQFLIGDAKRQVRLATHADICDMEIAGIAYSANLDRIPVLSMKIVSDSVFDGAKQYYEAKEEASLKCLEALKEFLDRYVG